MHVLDFSAQVYGTHISVRFLARLRDEMKFDGIDALKAQIACDVQSARDYFVLN